MKTVVRPACSTDMDSIYLMGSDVWGVGSSVEQYLQECRNSAKYQLGQWYCLESNITLISSLIIYKNHFELQDKYVGFGSISTAPKRRGEGFASRLINACVERLTSEGCAGVYLRNETDSNIYERLGFKNVSSSDEVQLMFLKIHDGEQALRPSYF